MSSRQFVVGASAFALAAVISTPGLAQTADDTAPAPAAEEAPARRSSPRAAPTQLDRVEVRANRATEERRQSTAAKIVIERDEIEQFGDTSIAETLRRLPGITTGGRPGRGGDVRMRGMGSGYTQILVNGERMPAGFSLDSLPPDQVERIEIMRAPTAEHSARAVAGTINIVLREPLQKLVNDVKLVATTERGLVRPQISWTRNDALGTSGAYNFTLSAARYERRDDIDNHSQVEDLASGTPLLDQHETGSSHEQRDSVHFNGRLQWRTAAGSLTLSPFASASRSNSDAARDLLQAVGATPPQYAHADSHADARFSMARVNVQGQLRLADETRVELRGYVGGAHWSSDSTRLEYDAAGAPSRRLDDATRNRDSNWNFSGKLTHRTTAEHALVGGWEMESLTRDQTHTALQDGRPQLPEVGEEFAASTRRFAVYLQDEWNPSRQWSAYAGLRWERIATQSHALQVNARNQSNVLTPLAHMVWKPDPNARDQLRLSLTRSYKSPTLSELMARPAISTRYPIPGDNLATYPDRVGNPDLKPELARGVDLAWERYLRSGGVLSANLFYRRIQNLIRSVTTLRDVPWSDEPRWVSQPHNVGDATTQGIELEAKFRLDEILDGAIPLSINSNLSLFSSRVASVPGPNNRIDAQPRATGNLGFEYRPRGLPLRFGANANWTPSSTIQRTEIQTTYTSTKIVCDAFVLWLIGPDAQLRLSASNLAPRSFASANSIIADSQRQTSSTGGRSFTSLSARLELKL